MPGFDNVRVRAAWERLTGSLWFVPGLLTLGGIVLATATLAFDAAWAPTVERHHPFFGGSPAAARQLLATIAGALISVVALAFSVLMVALSQVSVQYTPRLLGSFMGDRGYQVVLGTYIGTFVFTLLVLRTVRGDEAFGGALVPAISISMAFALTLCCLALLIYFFHHSAEMLQISTVLANLRRDSALAIDAAIPPGAPAPSRAGDPLPAAEVPEPPPGEPAVVPSQVAGYLATVDLDLLCLARQPGIRYVEVVPMVGAYVAEGEPLARVWADAPLDIDDLGRAFVIGVERTMSQDPRYGLRQLVDIALRALSPGINDPTTAEDALEYLGDLLAAVASRPFPACLVSRGGTSVWRPQPSFADFVDLAFGQLRRAATDPHTAARLVAVIARVRRAARLDASRVATLDVVLQVLAAPHTGPDPDRAWAEVAAQAKALLTSNASPPRAALTIPADLR